MSQKRFFLKKRNLPLLITVFILTILFAFPFIREDHYLMHLFVISNVFAILAASWDILMCVNYLSLGHSFFFGLSAYIVAILNVFFGFHPLTCIVAGAAAALAAGFILGLPFLKLRGAYFALAMAGVAEIARMVTLRFSEVTGGEEGICGVEQLAVGIRSNYYVSLILMVLSIGVMYFIANKSHVGVLFRSIRYDEDAAMSLGVEAPKYRLYTILLSSFFAGLAGGFYATYMTIVNPLTLAVVPTTANIVMMAVSGGVYTIVGPALGAYLLIFLSETLRIAETIRLLIFSFAAVLILLFLPEGIISPIKKLIQKISS